MKDQRVRNMASLRKTDFIHRHHANVFQRLCTYHLAGTWRVRFVGSCNSKRSFIALPLDPPKMYMLLECATAMWLSRGIMLPSVTNGDQTRFSMSKTWVSDKCLVPSCPPYKIKKFLCTTIVALYLARGRLPDVGTSFHLLELKSNSCKSDSKG